MVCLRTVVRKTTFVFVWLILRVDVGSMWDKFRNELLIFSLPANTACIGKIIDLNLHMETF